MLFFQISNFKQSLSLEGSRIIEIANIMESLFDMRQDCLVRKKKVSFLDQVDSAVLGLLYSYLGLGELFSKLSGLNRSQYQSIHG